MIRRIAAALFVALGALVLALGPAVSLMAASCAPPPAVSRQATEVRVTRAAAMHFKADANFTELSRSEIRCAFREWREVTGGRVSFSADFDLDAGPRGNFVRYVSERRPLIVGITSDSGLVRAADAWHGATVVALQFDANETRPNGIFVVADRVRPGRLCAIVMHELGHVLGLPDLPTFGAIMSGQEIRGGDEVPFTFTPADVALCRLHHFCE